MTAMRTHFTGQRFDASAYKRRASGGWNVGNGRNGIFAAQA